MARSFLESKQDIREMHVGKYSEKFKSSELKFWFYDIYLDFLNVNEVREKKILDYRTIEEISRISVVKFLKSKWFYFF